MALVEINWNPPNRQLKQFGAVSLFALPLIGLLWKATWPVIGMLAAIGGVIAVLALIFPRAVKPLFVGLSVLTIPIGILVGEIVLLSVFVLVFVPMGLVFRLIGRDSLRLRRKQTTTWWQEKSQPRGAASYYRQS